LHARQIDDFGTATQVKGNKAIWQNPTQIRAHFYPLNRMGDIAKAAAMIMGGGIVLAGVIFTVIRVLGSVTSQKGPRGKIASSSIPSYGHSQRAYSAGTTRTNPSNSMHYGTRDHRFLDLINLCTSPFGGGWL